MNGCVMQLQHGNSVNFFCPQTSLLTPAAGPGPTVVDLCSPSPEKTSPPLLTPAGPSTTALNFCTLSPDKTFSPLLVPADPIPRVDESHLSLAELEAQDKQDDGAGLEKEFASLQIENQSTHSAHSLSPLCDTRYTSPDKQR